MARERDLPAGPLVTPHLMAARPRPIEPVTRTSQPTRYLPVPEAGKSSHVRSVFQTVHDRHSGVHRCGATIMNSGHAFENPGDVGIVEAPLQRPRSTPG